MAAYELALSEGAAMAFTAAARGERARLLAAFEELKAAPFSRGDLQERTADGRVREILLVEDWLVTYWSDHAAKEIRVVRLERVESRPDLPSVLSEATGEFETSAFRY